MATSADSRIGSVLVGYRIEALLGRGGMGVVYRSEDLALERKVALKLLAPDLAADARFRERFHRESRLAASIDHASIVPVYEAGEADGQLYIAMRYVEGTDLAALLREQKTLEPERAVAICAQLADALDSAHARGLVHRDVKPSNVLIDERGHCYLADFGLTRRLTEQDDLSLGRSVGTVGFVAPEQIRGDEVGASADEYSLGCLLYECLTGETPFQRASDLAVLFAHLEDEPPKASKRNPTLPDTLDPILSRALAKTPEDRYPTCRELVNAAADALAPARPAQLARRPKLFLAALALLIAIALAATLALLLTRDSETRPNTEPTLAITTASIQRIDPETNELVATIPIGTAIGTQAGFQLALGAGSLWVANKDENRIYRVDLDENSWTEIPGTGAPYSLAFGAGSLWVTSRSDTTLSQIDPDTNAIVRTIPLPPGFVVGPIVADETAVWVAEATDAGTLVRIDALSLAPKPLADVGGWLGLGFGSVWSSTGTFGLAGNPATSFIARRLDPTTGSVVATVGGDPVGLLPLAVGEGGVWVTNPEEPRLLRIDPETNRISSTVTLDGQPVFVAAGEGAVWVVDDLAGTVSRIEPGSGKVVAALEVGPHPADIVAGEGAVWVAVHPE
jgi:serine/threonine protein kinase